MYQPSRIILTAKERQDLNRRFTEGYRRLMALITDKSTPEADVLKEEMKVLGEDVAAYCNKLKIMGLKDHHVPFIHAERSFHDVLQSAMYGLVIFGMASIPSFVLNAPVGLLARYLAKIEQRKALAGSKVKIAGRDVMLSKKISFSIVAVPFLWISYFFMAVYFTNWRLSSIVLIFWSFPLFSYFGVRAVEAGLLEFSHLQPLLYRLLPTYRKMQDELPKERIHLQKKVRHFVKKYSHLLKDLADETRAVDWGEYMKITRHPDMDLSIIEDVLKSPPNNKKEQ